MTMYTINCLDHYLSHSCTQLAVFVKYKVLRLATISSSVPHCCFTTSYSVESDSQKFYSIVQRKCIRFVIG